MDETCFAFWLQGYFELLGKDEPLTLSQLKIIKNHLNLVKRTKEINALSGAHKPPQTPFVPSGHPHSGETLRC